MATEIKQEYMYQVGILCCLQLALDYCYALHCSAEIHFTDTSDNN